MKIKFRHIHWEGGMLTAGKSMATELNDITHKKLPCKLFPFELSLHENNQRPLQSTEKSSPCYTAGFY